MRRGIAVSLFLFLSACVAEYPFDCVYVSKDRDAELERHSSCAKTTNSGLIVASDQIDRMFFSEHGLAAALINGQWFYFKRTGEELPVITFDNGADPFSSGLVRSLQNGKISYFNSEFRQIIPPKYDWGWPFENGRALVCLGCKKDKPDEMGHVPMTGGQWGYIDLHGREVMLVNLSRAEAMSK